MGPSVGSSSSGGSQVVRHCEGSDLLDVRGDGSLLMVAACGGGPGGGEERRGSRGGTGGRKQRKQKRSSQSRDGAEKGKLNRYDVDRARQRERALSR